jgi:DNA gyrase/topoisomerase IV subunit B
MCRVTGGYYDESGEADPAHGAAEDVVATDLIFTTLMGEDVESRRKFIEENALDVKNLDV